MRDDEWLSRLAGFGLGGAAPIDLPPVPIRSLLPTIAAHKLLGVLAAVAADGAVGFTAEDVEEIARAHEQAMREVLLLEEVLLAAVDVLTARGIDHRVLKGSALAHLVHPDPAERCFGDNDIVVPSDEVDTAVAALLAAGATRPVPALSPSFDRRFAKSVTLHWTGSTELDLHRTLAAGPYGHLIDLDDLWRDPVEVLLAGRAVRTLTPAIHLLHGAIHVALGDVDARLGNVRDLALLSWWPSVDPDDVVATAIRWGCAAPVAVGLRTTRALGHELSPMEEWAHGYEIDPLDERRLGAYRARADRYRRQARAMWRVLGWRDRAAFTRALLVPSAANRAARGRTRREQVRRLPRR